MNLLIFLEFLARNSISHSDLSHPALIRFLRGFSINSPFRPTPRGIFDFRTMYHISRACHSLHDPLLFRAVFFVSFYAFFRLSTLPPFYSAVFQRQAFSQARPYFPTSRDPHFGPKGKNSAILQFLTPCSAPHLDNFFLSPVQALQALAPLPPNAPPFVQSFPPFQQVIDTQVRDTLRPVLAILNISPSGHGFHTFRCSHSKVIKYPVSSHLYHTNT